MTEGVDGRMFLREPEQSAGQQQMYDDDLEGLGYVMNLSRLWAHAPAVDDAIRGMLDAAVAAGGLTFRQRGILVTACASAIGDSYCSLAWGGKLAGEADATLAAGVLTGDDEVLDPAERALARWARTVATDPNGTSTAEVAALREVGFTDTQIFAVTAFVAGRVAFSTVNDALGALPDGELVDGLPQEVREAVTWGRPTHR